MSLIFKMSLKKFFTLLLFAIIGSNLFAQQNIPERNFKFRAVAELGYLGVLSNKIQFDNDGTYFDYQKEGGQDVLFPVSRISLELDFKKRNRFVFLYQPLRLESQVLLKNNLTVDELLFPANSNVKMLYNFPFYRFSYLRELLPNKEKFSLGIGGSLQIRNTTISFESGDGELYRTNRNVGIVPIIKLYGKAQIKERGYLALEADGFYAPVSYLNGSDEEIIGAILDASLRYGLQITEPAGSFLNLRYIGGGAVGTNEDDDGPGDGYTKNWLNFITVSVGFVYEF